MTLAERMNPWFRRRHVLVSPLPAAECAARLRAELVPFERVWTAQLGMGGWIDGDEFALRHVNPGGRRLDSEVRGTFVPDASGTRIALSAGWSTYSRLAVVFLLLLCVALPVGLKLSIAAFPYSFVIVLPAAFVFAVCWGRWIARGDDDWLTTRLAGLCEAEVPHEPI